jgi:hypothetical protein
MALICLRPSQAQGDAVKAQGDAFHCVMVSLTNHGADLLSPFVRLRVTLLIAQGDVFHCVMVSLTNHGADLLTPFVRLRATLLICSG